jgi:hypothetical protein
LSHLILAHLSKDNNSPEKVETLFKKNAGTTEVVVASRYEESPVFQILPLGHSIDQVKRGTIKTEQLSIF